MAGDTRTLKLAILGEVKDLSDSLKKGENDVTSFGDKIAGFGKVAGAAFVAAGVAAAAYAGKLAIDGVKSAIEDEAAQLRLATSLKNVTGATDAQIKATEDYITKTQLAYGINDNELRPSLDRLVRSTKDVEEAQKLQTLAINIAAGTGKNLQAVSEALAKAHDGNFTALKKLGGGIDENIIKTKDFDAATAALSATFEGQATKQADTFDGKMRRLSEAFGEAKETVGTYILDAVTPMLEIVVNKVIPAIQDFTSNLGEKLAPVMKFLEPIINGLRSAFSSVSNSIKDNNDELQPFYGFMKAIFNFAKDYLAPFLGETLGLAFKGLGKIISGVIDTFAGFVSTLTSIYNKIKAIIDFITGAGSAVKNFFSGASYDTGGASFSTASLPSSPISDIASSDARLRASAGVTNITVNGAIDPISTARQIAQVLNQEATLSGNFNNLGTSLLVGA